MPVNWLRTGAAAGALVRNEDHLDGVCRGLELPFPNEPLSGVLLYKALVADWQ